MLKIAGTVVAVTYASVVAGCDPTPPKKAEPQCVVWFAVEADGDVVVTQDVKPPCQLNLIYFGAVNVPDCMDRGGRTGQLHDTCYDVDY
jgi:hypothetical protein